MIIDACVTCNIIPGAINECKSGPKGITYLQTDNIINAGNNAFTVTTRATRVVREGRNHYKWKEGRKDIMARIGRGR